MVGGVRMIKVVTTAFNCQDYIGKCIQTIQSQTVSDFKCYVFNDGCTDRTIDIFKELTKEDPRFILINNQVKRYQGGNYDYLIRESGEVQDEDIIVEVDGDDWLPDKDVFKRVLSYYEDGITWITYGQFVYQDDRIGFATPVDFSDLRGDKSIMPTHLRTWKPALWKKIKVEDLKVNGVYAEASGDVFFMLPMMEMAGPENSKWTPHINYVYNFVNPLGDSKGDRLELTTVFRKLALTKPIYTKIGEL